MISCDSQDLLLLNPCKRHVGCLSVCSNGRNGPLLGTITSCVLSRRRNEYYTFIECWWGKCENLFTQEYHIPWGQRPRGIWYSWMNKCSYFLNPHAINVLLYRIKPRKHIHVTYCWQTYFKSIATLSQTFKNHIHNKWCVPSASDVFLSKNDNSGGKTREASEGGGIWFLFHGIWFLSCVITCSDFYPLSKQINLFMVINIWGIII
jgi:hypothetical protein